MAVGGAATLAGWLLGSALFGARWRVEGITVSRPAGRSVGSGPQPRRRGCRPHRLLAGFRRRRSRCPRRFHRRRATAFLRRKDRAAIAATARVRRHVSRPDLHRQGDGRLSQPAVAKAGTPAPAPFSSSIAAARRACYVGRGEDRHDDWQDALFAHAASPLVGASATPGKARSSVHAESDIGRGGLQRRGRRRSIRRQARSWAGLPIRASPPCPSRSISRSS